MLMENSVETGHGVVENLLQGIKASKVLEDRIELIDQLRNSTPASSSDVRQIAECLTALWEENVCFGISQCKYNKSLLHAAQQHLQCRDGSEILLHFVILATKASKWCGKQFHSVISTYKDSSRENHVMVFIQLLLESLNFASTTFLSLIKSSYLLEEPFPLIVEESISVQLNLIKVTISEIKEIHFNESEILKAGHELLNVSIRLSSIYCRSIRSETIQSLNYQRDENSLKDLKKECVTAIISIASCTIENLYELGILAATGGGNLVAILNVSWKGVASLLQLEVGKEVMASKVNISNIILTLISLATDSLKLAAELWLLPSPDSKTNLHCVTEAEARKVCIPIKFYLINALRISSSYPCQAFRVCDDIISCVLKISSLRIVVSSWNHLRAAAEALTEILEPTSLLFLYSLLSSGEAGLDAKLHILDTLFPNESKVNCASVEENIDAIQGEEAIVPELFYSKSESALSRGVLTFGQVAVFLNLLQNPLDLGGEIVLAISKKLDWLLDAIAQQHLYVLTLQAQISATSRPVLPPKSTWHLMFPTILHALKTFFIMVAPSAAWVEVESFLFRNIIHPHFLCWELVLELWCFMVRHAHRDLIEENIYMLCSLFKSLALCSSASLPYSSLRKLARALCTILKYVPQSVVEHVYQCMLREEDLQSQSSIIIITALLQEAFPLHLLSDSSRKGAVVQITSVFSEFALKLGEKLGEANSACSPCVSLALQKEPMCFLAAILSQCHIEDSEVKDECIYRVPKLAVAVINAYSLAKDKPQRQYYSNILSYALEMMSYVKHRLRSNDIQDFLTSLHGLCTAGTSTSYDAQEEFKPALALFLASLSAVEIPEDEDNAMSNAIWQLYHLILRERHWAAIHLGLASFGYFAARTSCNELWRFVPHDAALSFDIESGQECNGEQFMSELKLFLEKENALISLSASEEEKRLLKRESRLYNRVLRNSLQAFEACSTKQEPNRQAFGFQDMEIDVKDHLDQKLKFSKGIKEGMSLLQKGLTLLNENFAKWQDEYALDSQQQDQLGGHLSSLAHVITQIARFEHS